MWLYNHVRRIKTKYINRTIQSGREEMNEQLDGDNETHWVDNHGSSTATPKHSQINRFTIFSLCDSNPGDIIYIK